MAKVIVSKLVVSIPDRAEVRRIQTKLGDPASALAAQLGDMISSIGSTLGLPKTESSLDETLTLSCKSEQFPGKQINVTLRVLCVRDVPKRIDTVQIDGKIGEKIVKLMCDFPLRNVVFTIHN